ncbi:hypothetical protein LJ725_01015 [Reyranella aquatilis]|uniref:Uncharacterized protein n=1 Tax=Reyranella aquatilis TaxID=2035356 RepID=A0ABS8KN99_9HYPH|nr:hypothetical protein [Reyranella aquatilis]MCC8427528.1 hypothetical protein [Reyranella aquatilis]
MKRSICVVSAMASMFALVCGANAGAQAIPDYLDLINHCPTTGSLQPLKAAGPGHHIQKIDSALSDTLMLDEYVIYIEVLPKDAAGKTTTPQQLLSQIRGKFDEFAQSPETSVSAYPSKEEQLWNSRSPIGALLKFAVSQNLVGASVKVEEFIVVLTELQARRFRLSTAYSPQPLVGGHPVSGVREFGIRPKGRGWELYTRAADRPTGIIDTALQAIVFKGADNTWRAFQSRIASHVQTNGGQATVVEPRRQSFSWKRDVLDKNLLRGVCAELRSASGTSLGREGLETALMLVAERDASRVTAALVEVGASMLKTASSPAERERVLADIRTAHAEAETAATPAKLLEVIEAKSGQFLSLSYRTSQWDATVQRFAATRKLSNVEASGISARALIASLRDAALSPRDLNQLLNAATGTAGTPTAETIASFIADGGTRDAVVKLLKMEHPDRATLASLGSALVGETTARNRNLVDLIRAGRTPGAYSPLTIDFRELRSRQATADSIVSRARTLAAMASLLGEPAGRDAAKVATAVESGMAIYNAASLFAAGSTSGGVITAMAIMGAAGGLSSGDNGSAALMQAIAELTSLVRQEFKRLNQRLDRIDDALERIEKELADQRRLSSETLRIAEETNARVLQLSARVDRLEANVIATISKFATAECLNFVSLPRKPSQDQFENCARLFQMYATQTLEAVAVEDGPLLDQRLGVSFPFGTWQSSDALWQGAGLIASKAARLLDLHSAAKYAERSRRNELAAQHLLVQGTNLLLLLAQRHGSEWFMRYHDQYVTSFDLRDDLLTRLEAVESFQKSLLPERGKRLDTTLKVVDALQAAGGYEQLTRLIKAQSEEAVRRYLLPELVGALEWKEDDKHRLIVNGCENRDSTYPILTFANVLTTRLPLEVAILGFVSRDELLQPYIKGTQTVPTTIPKGGLRICAKDVVENTSLGWTPPIRHLVSGKLQVHQHGVQLLQSNGKGEIPYGSSDYVSFESRGSSVVHHRLVTGILEDFFKRDKAADRAYQAVVDAFVQSRDLGVRLAVAHAHRTLLSNDDFARRQLHTAFDMIHALHGFLRGYLPLAYPALYAAHDELRGFLESGPDVRLLDAASYSEALRCADAVYLDVFPKGISEDDMKRAAENIFRHNECRIFSNFLQDFSLGDLAAYLAPSLERFREVLRNADLDSAGDTTISNTAWPAARLRALIRNGGDPTFWKEMQ